MESQHSVGVPTCHDFPRFVFISDKSRPEVGSRVKIFTQKLPLGEKDPLRANFPEMFLETIHGDIDPRFVCKFREIWPTGSL